MSHPDPFPSITELAARLDAVSLEQALRDVEEANARVMELTQRVIDLEAEASRRPWQRKRARGGA
jgi:hypothetical protein